MRLVLVGHRKELLVATVPENHEINTVILSDSTSIDYPNRKGKELIIVDLDNIDESPQEALKKLSGDFPNLTIWAYYSQNDCPVQKRLLEMGYNDVFSYEDNIAEEISQFALNT